MKRRRAASAELITPSEELNKNLEGHSGVSFGRRCCSLMFQLVQKAFAESDAGRQFSDSCGGNFLFSCVFVFEELASGKTYETRIIIQRGRGFLSYSVPGYLKMQSAVKSFEV